MKIININKLYLLIKFIKVLWSNHWIKKSYLKKLRFVEIIGKNEFNKF